VRISKDLLLGWSSSSGSHSTGRLEGIVDPPLKSGQGSDHENTDSKSSSGESLESDLVVDGSDGLTLVLGLSELGDHGIGWVRDDGTNNSGQISRSKGDGELSSLSVGVLWLGEDVLVEELDSLLEEVELGHGVWDLARPQWDDRSEWESGLSAVGVHLGESLSEVGWERSSLRSLDLDLNHLHGAEGDISDGLSRSRGGEIDDVTVSIVVLLSGDVGVEILEDLVESELEESLGGITDGGREPTLDEGSRTLLSGDDLHASDETLILLRVGLEIALDDIERSDDGVGDTAREDTGDHALEVVEVVMGDGAGEASVPGGDRSRRRWRRRHFVLFYSLCCCFFFFCSFFFL
jgi:hypothetical protein